MPVLVVGGTGRVGSLVVERLVAEGLEVKVLTRDPDKARVTDGAITLKGDILDASSFREALVGVTTLFLLNPVTPDETTRALLALELAARVDAGVVYVSMVNADVLPDVPHAVAKHAAETLIRERGIAATVLRPNYFMQNDADLREPLTRQGMYTMPIGGIGAAMIDVRDLAEVAAVEIAKRERTESQPPYERIDVSGPDVLTAADLCELWAGALDRPVSYAGDDLDAFEQRIAPYVPSDMALDVTLMFRAWQRIGVLPELGAADALASRLGRPLRTYRAFAAECAVAWRDAKDAAAEERPR